MEKLATPIQRMLDAAARYTDARFGLAYAKHDGDMEQHRAAQDALRDAEVDFEVALMDYLNQRDNGRKYDEQR